MSDASRGPLDQQPSEPGWWLASDGTWYPPELRAAVAEPRVAVTTKHCTACGALADVSTAFCSSCGSDLRAQKSPVPPGATGPAYVPTTAGSTGSHSHTDAYLLLAAVGLAVIGSFLPWVKLTAVFVGTVTKSGTEGGDGWIAIGLAVPLAIFGIRRLTAAQAEVPGVVALIFSTILAILVIYEISDVSHKVSTANDAASGYGRAEVGVGLWMLLIGAVLAVIGSIIAIRQRKDH